MPVNKLLRVLRTNGDWDPILADPAQHGRIIESFDRLVSYWPFAQTSGLLSWAPPVWIYLNMHDGETGPRLLDTDNAPLYVPWPTVEGPDYARTTADIRDAGYRAAWIANAIAVLDGGAQGIWIDDVNLDSDRSAVRSGGTAPQMDMSWWSAEVADFMAEINSALKTAHPTCEILHNSVWYANRPNRWSPLEIVTKIREWSFDSDTEDWVMVDGTLTHNTSNPYAGGGCLEATSSGTYYGQGPGSPLVAVTPGATITWSMRVWMPSGEAAYFGAGEFSDSTYLRESSVQGIFGNDDWQRVTVTTTVGNDCNNAYCILRLDSASVRTVLVDSVCLVEGATAVDYGVTPPTRQPVLDQITQADYINIEGGFADPGLNGGVAQVVSFDYQQWSLRSMMSYVDTIHNLGVKVIAEHWDINDKHMDYVVAAALTYMESGDGVGLATEVNRWPIIGRRWGYEWGNQVSVIDQGAGQAVTTTTDRAVVVFTPGDIESAKIREYPGNWLG